MNIIIKPSDKPQKKYVAIIDDKKHIYFGQAGASDMTQHKSEERKNRYIDRHSKRENWNDPTTPGFWSRWILWESPTLVGAVRNINRKFPNIHVKMR